MKFYIRVFKIHENTYTFNVTSNNIVVIGMITRPNQNTGDVNSIASIPTNIAATGKLGHSWLNNYQIK